MMDQWDWLAVAIIAMLLSLWVFVTALLISMLRSRWERVRMNRRIARNRNMPPDVKVALMMLP